MPELNDAQFGLFPAEHPAMRERSHAEMSTEQFRTLPGAYHHATYRATMPTKNTGRGSAGVHLGTRRAAMERVDDMGARDPNMSDIHADESKPADIHVRRLDPEVARIPEGQDPRLANLDRTGAHMRGTHARPQVDRGEDWSGDHYGEFYQNTHEDKDSISIRVPNGDYLDSHRKAVDRATRSGGAVHPEAAAALAGGHIDKPDLYTANSRTDTTQYARYQQRNAREDSASDNRDQGMLLPYKLQSIHPHKKETIPDPSGGYAHAVTGRQPKMDVPAVTFAATAEDEKALTSQTYKTIMGEKLPAWQSKTGKF